MERWMQQLKETYVNMVNARLAEGSLNVGKPGQMGEPMQPAMRPIRPGEAPAQYQEYGKRVKKELEKEWDTAEEERQSANLKTITAVGVPAIPVIGGIAGAALATGEPLGVISGIGIESYGTLGGMGGIAYGLGKEQNPFTATQKIKPSKPSKK